MQKNKNLKELKLFLIGFTPEKILRLSLRTQCLSVNVFLGVLGDLVAKQFLGFIFLAACQVREDGCS